MTSDGAGGSQAIGVLVYPHPFKDTLRRCSVPAGHTIREILGDDLGPLVVLADGALVEPEDWQTVIPQAQLVIRRIPEGDAGRIIGSIAILALSIYTGGVAGTAYGASWGAAAAAGVSIAGNLALNALVPPSMPSLGGAGDPGRLSFLTGSSNQIAAFTPIPRLYGHMQYYPPIPMTGLPYTELVGEDQYLRLLVVLGYGPLEIGGVTVGAGEAILDENTSLTGNPIKIGGTSIDQFEDVEFEIGDPDDVTLYTNTVVETNVNTALNHTTDPTTENQTINDNVQVTQTTDTDTDEVSLEVYFPALFTVSGQGNTRYARVNFEVHRSPASAGTWTLATSFTVSSIERKPLRRGVRIVLPSTGQYDIRLTRVSTFYGQENSFFSDCTWTVMRSIKRDVRAFDVDDTVVMALRIRATDQLGGRVDRLSVEATSVLPTWNGSAWVDAATRNPAWVYADIFSGVATKRPAPKSRIDTTELLAWANWCASEGFYCDVVLDADSTTLDRGRDVAASGLGTWHVSSTGEVSVVRDEVSDPEVLISPRSSADFSTDYTFHDLPHALRIKFIDPDRWEETERVVYADGYDENTATKFESLTLFGVTDADQAWKIGRYHLAQLILRPEIYSWSDDVRHLLYRRGQTINLASDVIRVGLSWGRVREVIIDSSDNVTGAVVDELVIMESGPSYGCRIQFRDGAIETHEIVPVVPGTQTITFATPISPVDYGSGAEPALTVGDQFLFGVLGQEFITAKITRIEPRGEFKAQIVAVPAAEDIFDAWGSEVPAFDPVITSPINVSLLPPTQPTIVSISSDSPPSPSGAPRSRMAVAFDMPPGLVGVTIEAGVRTKEVISAVDVFGAWRILATAPATAGVIYITEVEEQITYQVQVRARRGALVSSWSNVGEHTIGDSGWLSEPGATVGADWNTNLANIPAGLRNIFYQSTTPTAEQVGDYWIDSDDDSMWRWNGSSWLQVQDEDIAAALSDAANAQATADGKVVTFAQTSPPTADGVGDIWMDTNDNNRLYRWSGSAWVAYTQDVADWAKVFGTGRPANNATANTGVLADRDDVATSHIQTNAVTALNSAYTEAETVTTNYDTWNTIQTLSVTSAGGELAMDMGFVVRDTVSWGKSFYVRVQRASTTILQLGGTGLGFGIYVPTNDNKVVALPFEDSPSAGTYSYTLQVYKVGSGGLHSLGFSSRSLRATELKR